MVSKKGEVYILFGTILEAGILGNSCSAPCDNFCVKYQTGIGHGHQPTASS